MGWRTVMMASAALTAIVAAAIWMVVRDDPAERGYASYFAHGAGEDGGGSVWQGLRIVLGYRNTILLYLITGAFSGLTLMFAGLWGVPFLVTHHGYTTAQAATLASVLLVSWSASSIAWGWVSTRLGRRKAPMIAGLLASQALWAALVYVPGWNPVALVVLLIALGIATSAFILTFAWAKESVPARLAGTVSGIANMGVMTGGMVMQPLVGWVLDRHWTGALTPGGARLYELEAYRTAFSLLFAWGFVSLLCLLFTKESHCRQAA
jgi:MFS family permease